MSNVEHVAKPVRREDCLCSFARARRHDDTYWTYSPASVRDADGTVVANTGVAANVLSERRRRTCRALSRRLAMATTLEETLSLFLSALRESSFDVPFAAIYELSEAHRPVLRGATTENRNDLRAANETAFDVVRTLRAPSNASPTPRDGETNGIRSTSTQRPKSSFYVVTPASSAFAPREPMIVFGLNPRLMLDDTYREYLDDLANLLFQSRAHIDAVTTRVKRACDRKSLLRQAPVAMIFITGPEQRIELANDAFTEVVGRDVAGLTLTEAFPQLVGSDLYRTLQRAYESGRPLRIDEQFLSLIRNDSIEDCWLKFEIQPIRDENGAVCGLMAVAVDITEAVNARHTIERCSAERENLLNAAEAASRAKDEFLAMLGHELRNPLAPIMTALQLMKLKEPRSLEREREIIGRQANYLVKLVDDLLDVSRVARGKVTLNRTPISLGEVVSRAVETASPLFEKKRHVLTVDIPTQGLDVDGDALRLAQVFANLLTNAAKYTEPEGRITVSAFREGESAVVRIADNGPGIPSEQLPRLFDTFFQSPRALDRSQGGLGLGLALVKSFVSLHGGTVTASSVEGNGSTFEVRLPALDRREECPPPPPPCTREAIQQTTGERRRVLLVDDSDDILEIVAAFLRYEGFEVMSAHDAPSALQIAPSFRPNVAVLDIGLPAMDGYDLARQLRKELGDAAPKLIAMTGYGQEADRERAKRAGFAAHLVKPVDPEELLASVRS